MQLVEELAWIIPVRDKSSSAVSGFSKIEGRLKERWLAEERNVKLNS
jgi:hypothetical protein